MIQRAGLALSAATPMHPVAHGYARQLFSLLSSPRATASCRMRSPRLKPPRSDSIGRIHRLLEANLITIRVLQIDLLHPVISDDRFSGHNSTYTKLSVARIDVFATEVEGGIGVGREAAG